MPVPGGYGSPFFDGTEVTTFLESLDRCYKDHGIEDLKERKDRLVEYAEKSIQQEIKRMPEFQSGPWDEFMDALRKDYRNQDQEQLQYTLGYLEKLVDDFRKHCTSGSPLQSEVFLYCRRFKQVGTTCLRNGDLTDKALTLKFMYGLPDSAKSKAMRYATRGKRYDPKTLRTFAEVERHIEDHCAILKDMDDMIEEQGMGTLPTGFELADPAYEKIGN